MKQYYYLNGTTQLGPFTLDELRTKGLTPDTSVWSAGMTGWLRAGSVLELSSLFPGGLPSSGEPINLNKPTPAYLPGSDETAQLGSIGGLYPNAGVKPKAWLVEAILVTLLCCLPFGIVGIVFASRVDSAFMAGDYTGSQKASDEAGKWTKIGFFIGLGIIVLYALFFGAAMLTAFNASNP